MKNSKVLRTILVISGLIAIGVGLSLLLIPVAMYASVNIDVSNKVSLLSDLRAAGGALFAIGILILSGAFQTRLAFTSTIIATVLYLSYGFSRIYAIVVDGMPESTLLLAGALEIVIGTLCLFALVKYRNT